MDFKIGTLTQALIAPLLDSSDDYFCFVTQWYSGCSVDFSIIFSNGGPATRLCKVMGRRIHQFTPDDAVEIANSSVPRSRYEEIMRHVTDLGAFDLVSEHVMTRTVDCDDLIGIKWQGSCHWVKIVSAQHRNPEMNLVFERLTKYWFEIFPELGDFYDQHNQGGTFSDILG